MGAEPFSWFISDMRSPFGGICTVSVSYTHLDVYKRQGLPLADRDYFKHLSAWWDSGDGEESRARAEQIQRAADFKSYAPVWDQDWNRYPDAGALPEDGKAGYTAAVLVGTVDNMQMTEIVVMRYERGAGDKGTVLYALSADQYVKP